MKPGIYLGMAEADYFADPSIGGSSLKHIVRAPEEWWWSSRLNTIDRAPETETKAQTLGTLIHKLLLEGVGAYEATYAIELSRDDFPGALVTVADIEEVLEREGVAFTKSAKKAVKAAALKAACPDIDIWDDLVAAHAEETGGKIMVARHLDAKARIMQRIVARDPALSQIFAEGLPEVSVFWRDKNDVPCRMRVDWLTITKTIDLKSYNPRSTGKRRETNWANAIEDQGYQWQEAHYRAGRLAMRTLPIIGGTQAERNYVKRCIAHPDPSFSFVFAKTTGAPHIEEVWVNRSISATDMEERDRGLLAWADMRDAFGFEAPWFTPSSGGVELDETCFRSTFGVY